VTSGVSYADVCGGAPSTCPHGKVPARLRRPLNTSPAECGVTPARRVVPDFGPAAGSGPVYVVLAAPTGQTPVFQPATGGLAAGTQTSKALWVSDVRYTGPILVRGEDVTGGAPVLFYLGGSLLTEMQLPPGPSTNVAPSGWRNWPMQLAVTHSGCYRLQVDTNGSSEHVDFVATLH
jgi:hypothetical protein